MWKLLNKIFWGAKIDDTSQKKAEEMKHKFPDKLYGYMTSCERCHWSFNVEKEYDSVGEEIEGSEYVDIPEEFDTCEKVFKARPDLRQNATIIKEKK